ncbi:carbon-nitrogen family hydrolase [Paenibacillus sp. GCM10023248]|uniref:carbon-nitrogen family hydrolase n=1 Tax=Bacillales TaxID=1385 RepID=UPI0023797AE6|nr:MULTISPECIES: carbon-nitrogen family hydrolase [Bacillales]MDD9267702.1 carbon-nitrogen family hydrolase [Paenibacillus sp. MAHUQ-63]MDR6884514.1 putative amidohydrolase [Bacillus sp. 3255]
MSETQQLHLALIQMNITIGEPDTNFARLEQLLQEAVQGAVKPDVIVFPEMWNTGYALTEIQQLADPNGKRTRSFLSGFAKEHGVNIIGGSIAAKQDDRVLNTIYAFDRSGAEIAEYSKIHLFRLMDEEKYLHSGDQLGRFELEGVPAGAMICYDIRFPELARKLALDGARILFVPAEWPHPRLHHWRTLLTARAIENQMYVVSCNRVGTSGTTDFFGHSMVIDPWGEVLVEGGETEAVLRATIDLEEVVRVRAKIPVFEDRRPHLY